MTSYLFLTQYFCCTWQAVFPHSAYVILHFHKLWAIQSFAASPRVSPPLSRHEANEKTCRWWSVCTDRSVRPGASQGLVLSKSVQSARPSRRRCRPHLIRPRVSRLSLHTRAQKTRQLVTARQQTRRCAQLRQMLTACRYSKTFHRETA